MSTISVDMTCGVLKVVQSVKRFALSLACDVLLVCIDKSIRPSYPLYLLQGRGGVEAGGGVHL